MSKNYVLGLDIGVASVGWGIVDKDDGTIVDKGVRLFSESDPEQNLSRRGFRHTRRLIRRKEFRLYRTRRVLLEAGIIKDITFQPLDNPYKIRCKGLMESLSNDELATAILHLMKRNGFRYTIADDEDDSGNKTIKEEFLCQHQLALLEKDGQIRGTNNKYHYSLYKKEFLALLEKQHVNIQIKEKLLNIFEIRRHFSEGPGNVNSPSVYGRYLYVGAEPINLIEKMRGHCSIYPDELRAPKISPSSELFNFLNDLNNLTFHGKHISSEKKQEILETYILAKGKITAKQLADYLGEDLKNIDGFRVNSKSEPILTEFVSLKKIREAAKKNGLSEFVLESTDDFYILDRVFEIVTATKIIEERIKELKSLNEPRISNYVNCFANISGVSEYHAYSFKALYSLTEEMIQTSHNSQQITVTMEKMETNKDLKLPKEAIISPVVAKSVNQSFKIIKALLKKYVKFESIVIEMPRDKNSKEEKKNIQEMQKRYIEEKNDVFELIGGIISGEPKRDIIEKVILYKQQDGKSIYSGKPMDLKQIILNHSVYEIDHVIPYSVSFDDSRNNKVLVFASENQHKQNRTPKEAFGDRPSDWQTFEEFEIKSRDLASRKLISPVKLQNLLFSESLYSEKSIEGFTNRNLNDTRYACRIVLNCLQNYFKSNEIKTKIFVVNGKTTNTVRRIGNLNKDRHNHCHHAVDALIIASFNQSQYLSKAFNNNLYDAETGVFYTLEDNKQIFGPVVDSVARQLINFDPISDFKFSYKVDKKPNRSISDQTLYGTRYYDGDLYAIKKYKNIYGDAGIKLANLIRNGTENDVNKLLIASEDKKTFVLLQKIVMNYPGKDNNPFADFKNDTGDYIRKVCKKGVVGPKIINIRYREDKINSCLDLSKKYKISKHNVGFPAKLQLSPYRMDLYLEKDGTYKFVTVRYANVKFKNNSYYIDHEWYLKEKNNMKISADAKFANSFYKGDIIKRYFSNGESLFELFKVVNNAASKSIELSYFGKDTVKKKESGEYKNFQYMQCIGKNVVKVEKYSTDILGNCYLVKDEKLKLSWK